MLAEIWWSTGVQARWTVMFDTDRSKVRQEVTPTFLGPSDKMAILIFARFCSSHTSRPVSAGNSRLKIIMNIAQLTKIQKIYIFYNLPTIVHNIWIQRKVYDYVLEIINKIEHKKSFFL